MQDVSNGNLFCNVKEVLDTNVNIPPHPPDDHTTTNATCASSVPWGKRSTRTLTSPPTPPWRSYDNICNLCLFHVQHVKKSKISNPIPPFRKTSFLKFATLPRDRKWHISKSTTLPRAPYQPHAKNNLISQQPPNPGQTACTKMSKNEPIAESLKWTSCVSPALQSSRKCTTQKHAFSQQTQQTCKFPRWFLDPQTLYFQEALTGAVAKIQALDRKKPDPKMSNSGQISERSIMKYQISNGNVQEIRKFQWRQHMHFVEISPW